MHSLKVRFILYSIFSISLLLLPCIQPVFKNEFNESVTYYFYTQNVNYDICNASLISNGNSTIIKCDLKDAFNVKSQIKNDILGESIRIDNYSQETYSKIINKYQSNIVKNEICDGYKILLCYDKTLENCLNIDNEKVNIQIAISSSQINIGYPLIFNGF